MKKKYEKEESKSENIAMSLPEDKHFPGKSKTTFSLVVRNFDVNGKVDRKFNDQRKSRKC